MLLVWTLLTAFGLLVNLKAEPCSKGTLSSNQHPLSTTEICDKGNMTSNTATQVQPGTSITLSCQLSPLPYPQQCRTAIFVNNSQLSLTYGRSSSTTFLVRAYGKHTFTCKEICDPTKKLICGLDVESGNPPDEPQNVSCIQDGTNGHPTCTWDKGRLTYISTTYVVQLSNGTDVFCFSEGVNQEVGSLTLSKLSFDSRYKVVVVASNELGSAYSQPLVFMPIDIVKPHPPNFWVQFENSSEAGCTFVWSNETQERHCRLRYRPLSKHSWSMVESLDNGNWSLCGLEPHTAYEFQLSCKIHPERGLWSNWHTYQAWPPEAAISNMSGQHSVDIPDLQPGNYVLWVTASTAAGAGDWLALVLTCSFFILLACVCSVPPVRKVLHQLLFMLVPQWQSKAIPDPANATWVKNHTAMKAELMFPSSLFLPDISSFEEPETTQVEETFLKINLQDKLLFGSTGRRGNGDWPAESGSGQEEPEHLAIPGVPDGEVDEQQLPHLYKRMVVEVMEPAQTVSEYITNPITDMATTYLPLGLCTPEELPEHECEPLSIFPTASLTPSCGGNLTLDQVKINCSSLRSITSPGTCPVAP
ncbi:interleukin-12 receptor subunit beta-2 [Melanerpes formicivorus]|uniref:interleukin-12 receptor subunit beta-2 n=1 Tax=Melanerpes formicivorus TaxID=211600 RepID=UPI00358E6F42